MTSILTAIFLLTSPAKAQMSGWGSGLWGGQQGCQMNQAQSMMPQLQQQQQLLAQQSYQMQIAQYQAQIQSRVLQTYNPSTLYTGSAVYSGTGSITGGTLGTTGVGTVYSTSSGTGVIGGR